MTREGVGMRWTTPGEARLALPLRVRRWRGVANEGPTTRAIVKDAEGQRLGFVTPADGGLLFMEGPFEHSRAEILDELRGLGIPVYVTPNLEGTGIDESLRLRPGPDDTFVLDRLNPDDPFSADDPSPVWDVEGRLVHPETHEVLPPERVGTYWRRLHALDVVWDGWWQVCVDLLVRTGVTEPDKPPQKLAASCEVRQLARWEPGVIGTVSPRLDPPCGPVDPDAPVYVDGYLDDLTEVVQELLERPGSRMRMDLRRADVTSELAVVFCHVPDQDAGPTISGFVLEHTRRVDRPQFPPAGWVATSDGEEREVLAVVQLATDDPDPAQSITKLCAAVVAWAPAGMTPFIECDMLGVGQPQTAGQRRRAKARRERQHERESMYRSAVVKRATAAWEARQAAWVRDVPTGTGLDSVVLARIDQEAWRFLKPASVQEIIDPPVTTAQALLAELRIRPEFVVDPEPHEDDGSDVLAADWDEGDVSTDYPLPLSEWFIGDLLDSARSAFARAWLAGDEGLARELADAIVTRRMHRHDNIHLALDLALLSRDIDCVLEYGREMISDTGFKHLSHALRRELELARAAGERTFAETLEARGRVVLPGQVPKPMSKWPIRRHADSEDLELALDTVPEQLGAALIKRGQEADAERLLVELNGLCAEDCEAFLILSEDTSSGWLMVAAEPSRIAVSLAHPTDADERQEVLNALERAGLPVSPSADETSWTVWTSRGRGEPDMVSWRHGLDRAGRLALAVAQGIFEADLSACSWIE
jgi:hypothetical protein